MVIFIFGCSFIDAFAFIRPNIYGGMLPKFLAIYCAFLYSIVLGNNALPDREGEYRIMSAGSGWVEKELLETFYLIVEEFKTGSIDENMFHDRIYKIAERYGRHAGKEETSKNQMPLFSV